MTVTRRALLGLGSNMGDRVEYLRAAVAAIPDVVAVSDAYETDPVGGVEQDPFLNAVVTPFRSRGHLLQAIQVADAR